MGFETSSSQLRLIFFVRFADLSRQRRQHA